MNGRGFVLRDANPGDLERLARLHVTTFIETHGGPGPTFETREWQWRSIIEQSAGPRFCLVIAGDDSELVGFARGVPYDIPEAKGGVPGFEGELNKIYLLRKYHRQGLGSQLIGHVARRFLLHGVSSMLLFGEARSPSNGFYEFLGAERLYSPKGEFHGGYGWRDLKTLADRCSTD